MLQVGNIKSLFKVKFSIQQLISKIPIPEYALFSIYAIFIGAMACIAAVVFHDSINWTTELFLNSETHIYLFLVPAVGMLILSIMTYLAPNIAKRKGISEVIKAVSMRGGYSPFRITLFHFFAPVICIGTGNTLGPEGPTAQLGGGISSKIGNIIGMSDSRRRI